MSCEVGTGVQDDEAGQRAGEERTMLLDGARGVNGLIGATGVQHRHISKEGPLDNKCKW